MPRRPLRWNLSVFAIALGLLALGGSDAGASIAEPAEGPTVTLLEAGEGKPQVLRWAPRVGVPVRARMKMAMDISLAFDGNAMPKVDLPAYAFTVRATAGEADEAGRFPVETVYESVELEGDVEPMVRDALSRVLEPLTGMKLTFLVDARGFVSDANTGDLPPQILDLLGGPVGVRRMVESFSQPLPEGAVAPGARWQIEQLVRVPNAPVLTQSVIYELVGYDGEQIDNKITGRQIGEEQDFDSGVPGAQTTLKKAGGTIEGEATMRLDRLLPVRATNVGSVDFTYEILERGVRQIMEQSVTVRLEIEHLDDEDPESTNPVDAPEDRGDDGA